MTRAEEKAMEALEAVNSIKKDMKEIAAKDDATNKRLNTLEKAVAQLGNVVKELKAKIEE